MNNQPFVENAEELYQHAPFGYLTIQADGLIVNINTTLLKWLGYERSEIVNQKSFQGLLGMGDKIYYETHLMPMLQMQNEISEINIELRGKDSNKLPTLINAKRVTDRLSLQQVYRFSVLNISQRKQYEVELIIARKEAEQMVQRLHQINQELEQFAYTASHDLQAPLLTIYNLIGLMGKKGQLGEGTEIDKYFSIIKSNVFRMRLMIKDLLEYSKIDGNEKKFEDVSLNEVCKITLEMMQDEVNENNAVFNIPQLPIVYGDKIQLIRLFQNLFSNAVKYRSVADPVIRIEVEDKEDTVSIFVIDNGIGFEQEFSDQVFGFMKRLHSHDIIPGTGIGLSSCKRIVEIHGGTIGVKSALDEGSTFYFTLPKKNKK